MSPGAGQRPFADVVYVWSVAIALNLALYFLVSLIFLIITKYFKKTWNSKQQLKIIQTHAVGRGRAAPLMRATWTPPTVKRSRCVTCGIRLQLYIRSTVWAVLSPDQDEFSLETASFVRRSFRSPASTGFDFLGLTVQSSTVFADSVGTSLNQINIDQTSMAR
jgi:hypothetical protein